MLFFNGNFNIFLIAAAVIPALVLMILVYRSDKLERESLPFLLKLAFFGMLSTALASVLEQVGELLLAYFCRSNFVYRVLLYFVVVGLGEELCKFLLLKSRSWNSPEFNCRYDGVVYAVFVALGFALWENVQYVLIYGFETALVRALTAVPGHCAFGVFMGIWYGNARDYKTSGLEAEAKRALTLSVLLPGLIHGLYDFIATSESALSTLLFLPGVILLFIFALISVKKAAKKDEYFVEEYEDED